MLGAALMLGLASWPRLQGQMGGTAPPSSQFYSQAADYHLREARRLVLEGDKDTARREFEHSRMQARKGLGLGPSDPYAWFVLAYAEQALDGPSAAALYALDTSFTAGLNEGALLVPRISWCFEHWQTLPGALKVKAKRQIVLALGNNTIRRHLADYAASLPTSPASSPSQRDFLDLVEEAGQGNLKEMASFTYWLGVATKKSAS